MKIKNLVCILALFGFITGPLENQIKKVTTRNDIGKNAEYTLALRETVFGELEDVDATKNLYFLPLLSPREYSTEVIFDYIGYKNILGPKIVNGEITGFYVKKKGFEI